MCAASRISPLASAPFLDRYEMTRTVADDGRIPCDFSRN
jgi:hypothetical protein